MKYRETVYIKEKLMKVWDFKMIISGKVQIKGCVQSPKVCSFTLQTETCLCI